MLQLKRRSFIVGMASMFAAPAVVKAQNIMQVFGGRVTVNLATPVLGGNWLLLNGAPITRMNYQDLFDHLSVKYPESIIGDRFYLPKTDDKNIKSKYINGKWVTVTENTSRIVLAKVDVMADPYLDPNVGFTMRYMDNGFQREIY